MIIVSRFDNCNGHATETGVYHYHQRSPCIPRKAEDGDNEETPLKLHGVALDGFLIYGPLDGDGNNIGNDRLDECHGSSDILPNGQYAYFLNGEYPYTLGCFKAEVSFLNTDECVEKVEGDPSSTPGDSI